MKKLVLLAVVLLVAVPVVAKKKHDIIEKYEGNAIAQVQGGSSLAEINIYRWTSDEEREELLGEVKDATAHSRPNDRAVAKALRGYEKVGYAFFASQQGYPLRYARKFEMPDGKTKIILATDRPVSFQEVYSQSQLGDFDVTLVVLNLDKDGKGDGYISVGTEVKWNDAEGKIEITNTSSQPVSLRGVRRVDKK